MVAQINAEYMKTRPLKALSRLVSYVLFEGRPVTTKGQWINSFLFANFSLVKVLPQLKRVKQPTFILGTGRSGTTILGVVLSMHRQVGFLNEPKALWHSIYPQEDLIGSYSRVKARYTLFSDDANDKIKRNAHRLFGAYLRAVFSQHVVDKYPELIFRVPFVKAIFPDAKFLFLARNGWDTCHSINAWSSRLGRKSNGETHDWWGVDRRKWTLLVEQVVAAEPDLANHAESMLEWTNHSDMAAVEWIVTMRQGIRLLQEYPEDVLLVDYNELCAAPRAKLKNITAFMGLDQNDETFLRYAEQTLKPAQKKEQFRLHPVIDEAFRETMLQLGYEV